MAPPRSVNFIDLHPVQEERGFLPLAVPLRSTPSGARSNGEVSGGRLHARAGPAPAALRPQMKVVRGGGSAPGGLADSSGPGVQAASGVRAGSAGAASGALGGMAVPGQTAAQLGAQLSAQQSI